MGESGKLRAAENSGSIGPGGQATGSATFQQQRKQDSRERLLAAAVTCFSEQGYYPVSVEDIASRAGVSRMTFYRHFRGKEDIANVLYRDSASEQTHLLSIRDADWRDYNAVHSWLRSIFESDRADPLMQRVFIQVSAVDPGFTKQAHEHIETLIDDLGKSIPAFALRADHPDDRRRWLEAWLLIYEILDQGNHAALESGVSNDPLVLDILTDRFLAFVGA